MRTLHPIPSLLLGLGLATAPLQADTLAVLPGTSIQAKINEAADGDIIAIFGGSYSESITINKAVRLVELQGQEVTITGHVLFDGVADCPPFEGFNVGGPAKNLIVRDTTGLTISGVTSIGNGVTVEGDSEVSITNSNLSRVHQSAGSLVLSHSTITYPDSHSWGFLSQPGALQTVLYRVKAQGCEIQVNSRRNWIGYCQIENGGLWLGWNIHDGERKFVVVGTEIDRGDRPDRHHSESSGVMGQSQAGSIVITNCWIHSVRAAHNDGHQDHVIEIHSPSNPILIQNNHLEHGQQIGGSHPSIDIRGGGDFQKVLIRNNYMVNARAWAVSAGFGAVVQGNVLRGNGETFDVGGGVTISESDGNIKLAEDTDPGFEEGTVYRLAPDSVLRDAGTPNPLYNDRDGSRTDAGASGGAWYDPEGWTTDKPVVISFDLTPELVLEGVNTEVTVDEVKAVSAP